jgi:hypothetical protein
VTLQGFKSSDDDSCESTGSADNINIWALNLISFVTISSSKIIQISHKETGNSVYKMLSLYYNRTREGFVSPLVCITIELEKDLSPLSEQWAL